MVLHYFADESVTGFSLYDVCVQRVLCVMNEALNCRLALTTQIVSVSVRIYQPSLNRHHFYRVFK